MTYLNDSITTIAQWHDKHNFTMTKSLKKKIEPKSDTIDSEGRNQERRIKKAWDRYKLYPNIHV